jgi:hypothetical protein
VQSFLVEVKLNTINNLKRDKIMLSKQFSGIHIEVFYTKHYLPNYNLNDGETEFSIPDFILEENLKEDYDIKLKYNTYKYNSFLDYVQDKYEEEYYDAKHSLEESCLMYNWVYEPRIYDEAIADLCDLIPFEIQNRDEDLQLLSFGGCGMDFTYKLEAYQLLADGSYDERSNFAEKGIAYFEYYYGKDSEVVKEINKLLENSKAA